MIWRIKYLWFKLYFFQNPLTPFSLNWVKRYLVEIQAGLQAAVSQSFRQGRSLRTDSGPLHGLSGPQYCRIYLSRDCELLATACLEFIYFSYKNSYLHSFSHLHSLLTFIPLTWQYIFSINLHSAKLTRTFLQYWFWRPNLFQSLFTIIFPVICYTQKLGLSLIWRNASLQSSVSAIFLQNSVISLLFRSTFQHSSAKVLENPSPWRIYIPTIT